MRKSKNIQSGLLDSLGRKNRSIPDKPCESCGKVFRPVDSKKRTCSRKCGYKIRILNPPSKGMGIGWVDSKGYIQIKIDGKNVRQHRHLMELHLSRKLLKQEDVHHINGNKQDNRICNLQVLNHSLHSKITNLRQYRRGYKLILSDQERFRRSENMKRIRQIAIKKATA